MTNSPSTPHSSQQTCSNLFGLLLGDWDFEWIDSLFPKANRKIKGEWNFSRLSQYYGICDTFICPSRAECAKLGILPHPRITQRLYNTQTGEWNIYDGDDDNLCRYHTEFTNDSIIITDVTSTAPQMRWLFREIELHSFKWECQTSSDNGKSWRTIEELVAHRRLSSE